MRKKLIIASIGIVCLFCLTKCENKGTEKGDDKATLGSSAGADTAIFYVAPDTNIFVGVNVIQNWVDKFDDAAIDAHAWTLWGGITALTNQKYPLSDTAKKYGIAQVPIAVFSTWWSELEVFNPPPVGAPAARNIMPFHGPRQVSATPGKASPDMHGGGEVVSFNKYTLEFKDYVTKNGFNTLKALCDLKLANVDSIPQTFEPKKSMMLKPSFICVSATKPVLVPYWKGPGMTVAGTTDPDRPISSTWTQWVLFNPTSQAIPPGTKFTTRYTTKEGTIKDTTLSEYEVVGLKDFYYLPLTPQDINYIRSGNVFTIGGITPDSLKVGDLVLMVACHVTSIEFFEDWTWQTFWWSPHPSKTPPASANVKAPFNHYDLMHSYYMIGKDKQPFISQNPYLEPGIIAPIVKYDKFSRGLGVRSNCMSCHHSAAFPTSNMDPSPAHMLIGSYIGAGQVNRNNPVFGPPNNRRVNTNFMWSMILLNQGRSTPDGKDSLNIYLNTKH